ncbi:hypothetical protein T439DRAFT_327571 [Meredithblackwellia eburnea MCA 4105]
MNRKELTKHLSGLFSSSSAGAATPASTLSGVASVSPFPQLALPPATLELLDVYLSAFHGLPSAPAGSNTSSTASNSHSGAQESPQSRERAQFRDFLSDLYLSSVDPLPGTESTPASIGRISAFLVLLEKLGVEAGGDDEDGAVITRRDVATVWWSQLLKRVLLGSGATWDEVVGQVSPDRRNEVGRGRKGVPKKRGGKETFDDGKGGSALRPLTVSRSALDSTVRLVSWAMYGTTAELGSAALPTSSSHGQAGSSSSTGTPSQPSDAVGSATLPPPHVQPTAFAKTVWEEYLHRARSMVLEGEDEGYGVRNLEECIVGWADRSPELFFTYLTPSLALPLPTSPFPPLSPNAYLPPLHLLLAFLTLHPSKCYHILPTSLLPTLTSLALRTSSPNLVDMALRSLVVLVVTLPVILGEANLMDVFRVWGRAVSWDTSFFANAADLDSPDPSSLQAQGNDDEAVDLDSAYDEGSPDPLPLFTVLYGTYPCNFVEFLRDARAFLSGKPTNVLAGVDYIADSAIVRDRSGPLLSQHLLTPALLSSTDLSQELTDTSRWRRLEAADVMAACDRNLVNVRNSRDYRSTSRGRQFLNVDRDPSFTGGTNSAGANGEGATTPTQEQNTASTTAASTPTGPASRSRSRTPLLPSTTHYTNFQALQQQQLQSASSTASATSPLASPAITAVQPPPVIPTAPALKTRRSNSPFSSSPFSSLRNPSASRSRSRSSSPIPPANSSRSQSPHQATLVAASQASSALHALTPAATRAQLVKLQTQLVVLQGEVSFQQYLKQLHLAHMGTLHREKVLDSGAEAERQSLYRTIRVLRAQLQQTKASLDKLRGEAGVTKTNWVSHIDDLRGKLGKLREDRQKWDAEGSRLRAQVEELQELGAKREKDLEESGAALFDLQNQVAQDQIKLDRISEYEKRIEALTKTLAICDEDLFKFRQQQQDMTKLATEWKQADLIRETSEKEIAELKRLLQEQETELTKIRNYVDTTIPSSSTLPFIGLESRDSLVVMRKEMERLRARNAVLEEDIKARHAGEA